LRIGPAAASCHTTAGVGDRGGGCMRRLSRASTVSTAGAASAATRNPAGRRRPVIEQARVGNDHRTTPGGQKTFGYEGDGDTDEPRARARPARGEMSDLRQSRADPVAATTARPVPVVTKVPASRQSPVATLTGTLSSVSNDVSTARTSSSTTRMSADMRSPSRERRWMGSASVRPANGGSRARPRSARSPPRCRNVVDERDGKTGEHEQHTQQQQP